MVMSLNNLKLFIEVADNGNITKTAERLFISQPAISKAIRNIEKELNVKLFYRDKRNGLKLTDIGEQILVLSRQMVLTEEKMYQMAYRENNFMGGKLKIGSIPITMRNILVPALEIFCKKYPFVNVELFEGSTNEIKNMVVNHEIDFGISISPFDDLPYNLLQKDYMIGISKEKRNQSIINLNETSEKLIVCKAGIEAIQPILEEDNVMDFSKYQITQSSETVKAMTLADLGVGVISKLVLGNDEDKFYTYPVSPEILMDIALISYDFDDLSPVAKEFIKVIESINSTEKQK